MTMLTENTNRYRAQGEVIINSCQFWILREGQFFVQLTRIRYVILQKGGIERYGEESQREKVFQD